MPIRKHSLTIVTIYIYNMYIYVFSFLLYKYILYVYNRNDNLYYLIFEIVFIVNIYSLVLIKF